MIRLLILIFVTTSVSFLSNFWGLPTEDPSVADYILMELRIPRWLAGCLVGGILGASGAAYQTLFRNSLASPGTVGTIAGAMLGVGLAAAGLLTWVSPVILALAGGLTVSLVLMAWVGLGRLSGSDLVLAGLALALGASALGIGLQTLLDARGALLMTRWSLGHLEQIGYDSVGVFAVTLAILVIGLRFDAKRWEVLALGDTWGRSQGVSPKPVQLRTLLLTGSAVSITVALCGPITFIGLLAPHLCRLFRGGQLHLLVPLSALVGAAGLASCDSLGRILSDGSVSIPVGALTGALGAPLLVILLISKRRSHL